MTNNEGDLLSRMWSSRRAQNKPPRGWTLQIPIGGGTGGMMKTTITKMKATMTKRRLVFLVMVAAVGTALAGAALATPPTGIVSATVLARAGFADPVDMEFTVRGHDPEVIRVTDAEETVVQQVIIGPGGDTGWHSHPGPAVVLIKAGELTFYSGDDPTCTGRTYSAGQAFIDSGQGNVHIARNLSQSQNLEVWVTYFDVPHGGVFRIDAADPGNCGF